MLFELAGGADDYLICYQIGDYRKYNQQVFSIFNLIHFRTRGASIT